MIWAGSMRLGLRTNNAAEYAGAYLGLRAAASLPDSGEDLLHAEDVTNSPFTLVRDGLLFLTESQPRTGGSAVFELPSLPRLPVPPYFRASVSLIQRGGSGGAGFSFSYGELPNTSYISELGAGSGLRLLLKTAQAPL